MGDILTRSFLVMVVFGISSTQGLAGPRERAKAIHDRITGIPPSEAVLTDMAQKIQAGDLTGAARVAMENENFYRVTVKNLAATWTNTDEKNDVPLNDYSATVIGMVRDEISFDQLLYGDIIYTARAGLAGVAAYSPQNNQHYEQFETAGFSYKTDLAQQTQSTLNGINLAAGVFTTRAFGEAYYQAGTNRRPIAFSLKTFLCREIEEMHDNTRPDGNIRRDVDRRPGGDPAAFINQCKGCHSGMDPLSRAFAYIDFEEGRLVYSPGEVREKINRNSSTYLAGYVTQGDEWENLWTDGTNKVIGWNGQTSGTGPASFGQMLSQTETFPTCMTEHVFKAVCLREPANSDESKVAEIAGKFKASGLKMKEIFANVAVACTEEYGE